MVKKRPLPPELLQASKEQKLRYFKDIIILHRNIQMILERLLKNAIEPDDA